MFIIMVRGDGCIFGPLRAKSQIVFNFEALLLDWID